MSLKAVQHTYLYIALGPLGGGWELCSRSGSVSDRRGVDSLARGSKGLTIAASRPVASCAGYEPLDDIAVLETPDGRRVSFDFGCGDTTLQRVIRACHTFPMTFARNGVNVEAGDWSACI